MADCCVSRDCATKSDVLLLDSKDFTLNSATELTPESQNLWSRSLARTWTSMLLLGTCLLYCARMAMPICAVSMANTFEWSKTQSGLVLGGFYWGYCLTQVLGGHASDTLGGERVLCISTALWAVITAATPLLAKLGSHQLAVMILARLLMGLAQGVFYPSLASLCSQRVAEAERSFLMSTMSCGCYIGTVLVGGLGSLLLDWYGWESVFYGIGLLSGLWALIVWQCLLKGDVIPKNMLSGVDFQWRLSNVQWLPLLKKPSVCAMMFAHMCCSSTSYILLSWLPTFLKETFPQSMGWVNNVVPFVFAIPVSLAGGYVSDVLISEGYTVSCVRKLMQLSAMGVSSVFIILLYTSVSLYSALACVTVAVSLGTFTSSGVAVNVQDLAPSSAGALFGFMNMCGAFAGMVLVSASGYLMEVTSSWSTIFFLVTLVNVAGLGVFIVFGDAQRVDLKEYRFITTE